MKVALAMIVGGVVDEDKLGRCISSAEPLVDHVFVNWNGAGEWPLADNPKVTVQRFEWEGRFDVARAQSFQMVPESEFDWVMWLDADDVLEGADILRRKLEAEGDQADCIIMKYSYFQQDDKDVVVQWRERIFRTGLDWWWRYWVHEAAHGRPGSRVMRIEPHHSQVKHDRAASDPATRQRNRSILLAAHKAEPWEPRYVHYLANESFAFCMDDANADHPHLAQAIDETIELYQRYMRMTTWDEDAYVANGHLAECYRLKGDWDRAVDTDLQSLKTFPTRPNAMLGLSRTYFYARDFEKALHWAKQALDVGKVPDTLHVSEPLMDEYQPLALMGAAHAALGQRLEALTCYYQAKEIHTDEALLAAIENLQATPIDTSRDWIKTRRLHRGTRPERSVAIVVPPLFEAWHPSLEGTSGFGGAELCVMRLAEQLRDNDWRVVVFGTPGAANKGLYEGIEWYDTGDFEPHERFTAVISSRSTGLADMDVRSPLILWVHDCNMGEGAFDGPYDGRLHRFARVVGLTRWHAEHLGRLYEIEREQLAVIPNAVEVERYPLADWTSKRPYSFAYASSPDRGLDVVLTAWPEIRRKYPLARLDVYYGWTGIDKMIAMGSPSAAWLKRFKASITSMVEHLGGENGGIFWHDRVPQVELAKRLTEHSSFWLYPTNFCETFCRTAVEMQMAGVVPVARTLAALPEVLGPAAHTFDGHTNNVTGMTSFLGAVDAAVKGTTHRDLQVNREFAERFSWEKVYPLWEDLLLEVSR